MNAHWPASSIHRSPQILAKPCKDKQKRTNGANTGQRVIDYQLEPGHAEPWQIRAFPHIFRRRHHYFQGTRLRMRTIPRDGKARDDTITPVRSEWCSRGYPVFSWDGTMESSVTMRAVCSSPFVRRRLGLDRMCRGTTRRDRWQGDLEESG